MTGNGYLDPDPDREREMKEAGKRFEKEQAEKLRGPGYERLVEAEVLDEEIYLIGRNFGEAIGTGEKFSDTPIERGGLEFDMRKALEGKDLYLSISNLSAGIYDAGRDDGYRKGAKDMRYSIEGKVGSEYNG